MWRVWWLVALAVGLRDELDSTPHPCKDQYHDAEIETWVAAHLHEIPGGHSVPHLLLMLGGSGAGKGTFIKKWKSSDAGKVRKYPLADFAFHGLDEYLPYVPEYARTMAEASVYKDAADACYSGAAIPAAQKANKKIISERMHVIYEETGKSLTRITGRLLPAYLNATFRVTVVLVHNTPEVAIRRVAGRFQKSGRYAADDYVRDTFKNNFETYEALKGTGNVAEFVYCDNSGAEMRCWPEGDPLDPLVPRDILEPTAPTYMKSEL